MSRLDWRDFGAVPDGSADSTQAINDCFQAAIETGLEAHGPAGVYRITDSLVWNGPTAPRICGTGPATIIRPTSSDFDWVRIGTGVTGGSGTANGWVRDLIIGRDPAAIAPPGTTAGLVIDGIRGVEVRNVLVHGTPIGFDLRNNCFGASFTNCRTIFDRQRVGILLRGPNSGGSTNPFGAGNDINFTNCWFQGREAAVWIEPNSANYTFIGGQLGVVIPGSTQVDDAGVVKAMQYFNTGEIVAGGTNVQFFGVSFERVNNAWCLRSMAGGASFALFGCGINGDNGSGICKIAGSPGFTQGGNDRLVLMNTGVHGTWTLPVVSTIPQWFVLNTNVAGTISPQYTEHGTFTSGAINVNGSTTLNLGVEGMLMSSRIHLRAHATSSRFWMHASTRFRRNGAAEEFQVSFDHGVTWNTVQTEPAS